jgi:hypothetical protein
MRTPTADADDLASVLKPFLALALAGFVAGFLGYWALARFAAPSGPVAGRAQPAVMVLPAATPENPPLRT